MRENRGKKGLTLMEMLVAIAIIAVLIAIIVLFLSRNLDRSRAAVNAANLRAVRSQLTMELLADRDNADEVIRQVLSTAPTAAGVDVPGMSVPEGTPMDAIVKEDGVDTVYGDYDEEDFEDVYQDGTLDGSETRVPGGESEEPTQITLCGVLTCFSADLVDGEYCSEHQIKRCEKSVLEGNTLVPCNREYRDRCDADHYKLGTCPCKAIGSQRNACYNCDHWHYREPCSELIPIQDNNKN